MARILIHTLGSAGDVNPFFALAEELHRRGHQAHFALSPSFAAHAVQLGYTATVVGPDSDPQSDLVRRLLAPNANVIENVQALFQEALIPAIVPAARALEPLVAGHDLFISHNIQLAAPAVAACTGTPWITAIPAITCYPSAVSIPNTAWLRPPAFLARLAWRIGRLLLQSLDQEINQEYRLLGVPERKDVLISGAYSRRLTVGLWSPSFFPRPSDWPDWLQVGGYSRWDLPAADPHFRSVDSESPVRIVFTLGSSVVHDPRGYYETAIRAIEPTPWHVDLIGPAADFSVPEGMQNRVHVIPYAPYSDIFPGAQAVVHQGGVGTTQAACYYGIPSLVVPRSFDQWENAAHIQRNGWGLRLRPQDFSPSVLRLRLRRLLSDMALQRRAAALGEAMRSEDGMSPAADLIEASLL